MTLAWEQALGERKGRRACIYVSGIWISALKKWIQNADWQEDISNDVITLGTCFSMFVYIRARFCFALIGRNLTAQSMESHRGIEGGFQIPKTKLQALLPSFSLPAASATRRVCSQANMTNFMQLSSNDSDYQNSTVIIDLPAVNK